jgi:hypothetical protein
MTDLLHINILYQCTSTKNNLKRHFKLFCYNQVDSNTYDYMAYDFIYKHYTKLSNLPT